MSIIFDEDTVLIVLIKLKVAFNDIPNELNESFTKLCLIMEY